MSSWSSDCIWLLAQNWRILEHYIAAAGRQRFRAYVESGGLAGIVRSDQAHDFAGLEIRSEKDRYGEVYWYFRPIPVTFLPLIRFALTSI